MRRFFIILFTLVSVGVILADKSQQSLSKEKQQTNKEIKETTQKISDNKKETRKQVNLLNQLSAQIQEKTEAIEQLQLSIDSIDGSMSHLNDSIKTLEQNLNVLRDKYGEVLRSIRATRHSTSNVAFIFSANSFSDAYRRIRYLRQFASWQSGKTQELRDAIASVDEAKKQLVELHSDKASTMKQVSTTQIALKKDEKQQAQIVTNLNKERAALEAYLKQKKQEAKQLDNQLNQLIAKQKKEAERKRKEQARKKKEKEQAEAKKRKEAEEKKKQGDKQQGKTPPKKQEETSREQPPKTEPATPQTEETSGSDPLSRKFERNKGLLPYPADGKCRIVSRFGRQKHPQLPEITTDNPGVDIELLSGNNAKAVFEGTVSAIFQNPGYHTIVMIRHGEYITIYANLATINVRVDDKVSANQVIGSVYANPDDNNRRILHFEVRKETQKLNPQQWIK